MPSLELASTVSPAPPWAGSTPMYYWSLPCPVASPTIGVAGWTQAAASPNWGSVEIPASLDGRWFTLSAYLPVLATSLAPILSFDLYMGGATVYEGAFTYGAGRHSLSVTAGIEHALIAIRTPPFPLADGIHTVDLYWQNTGTGGATLQSGANSQALLLLETVGDTYPSP